MARTARRVTVGFLMTMALTGLGRDALAGDAEPLAILLQVHNHAGVAPAIVERAKEEVARIYRGIGVESVWVADPSQFSEKAPEEAKAFCTSIITINLLSAAMENRVRAADDNVVGVAASGTRVAHVMYSRVETTARKFVAPVAQVLGHVIAHEIGHLLLPPNSHSSTGLMSASLDLQLAARSMLMFTPAQGALIRTKVSGAPQLVARR